MLQKKFWPFLKTPAPAPENALFPMKFFDKKPFVIPIFIPNAGCPHRCIFCNQSEITGAGSVLPSSLKIRDEISGYLNYAGKNRNKIQISFFGGNFLGLKPREILFLLEQAAEFIKQGKVDSLRFSTRPDTINHKTLSLLDGFPVETIEIGAQSMNDEVLAASQRGHKAADTRKAAELLKQKGYETGIQMMTGLPKDTPEISFETARKIADLGPDFVRIYPAVVLKNSKMATLYKKGQYSPLGLDESISLVKDIWLFFTEKNIKVIRMGLQLSDFAKDESVVIAGPYHPAFGHLVYSKFFLDKAISIVGKKIGEKSLCKSIKIYVHSRNISRMGGLKNQNLDILGKMLNIKKIKIIGDDSLNEYDIIIP